MTMLKNYIREKVALVVDGTQSIAEAVGKMGPAALWRVGEQWPEASGLELAVIAVAPELRCAIATEMCRRKMDFAVLGMPSSDADERVRLARRAKKAHLHTAVLGSFRYCWPVCALRELTVSGCLGGVKEVAWTVKDVEDDGWRVRDAMKWLAVEHAEIKFEPGEDYALRLIAEKGGANLKFNLDGWGKIDVASENIRKKMDWEKVQLPEILMEISVIQNAKQKKYGWTGLDSLQDTMQVYG